jgi:D-alanine-D-alanine ligase-like ATP-grasp enzyme
MSYVLHVVHGGIGEDGTIQTLLESAGVPYTGSLCCTYIVHLYVAKLKNIKP